MFVIEMSEQELNYLKLFITRIPLTGDEALVYLKLKQTIHGAKPKEETEGVNVNGY